MVLVYFVGAWQDGTYLANETAGRVDDGAFATICYVAAPDHLVGFALLAETQTFQEDELVCREAIVQLAHLDVLWRHIRFTHRCLSGPLCHVEADKVHRRS